MLVKSGIKQLNSKIAEKSWKNEDGTHNTEKFMILEQKSISYQKIIQSL